MKIGDLKHSKLFHFGDIFVYISTALIISILFLVFFILPNCNSSGKTANGFKVENDGKTIITHIYGTDEFTIDQNFSNLTKIQATDYGHLVTIYTNLDKTEFNVLKVNDKDKTVKMERSNCRSKQCTYLHEIDDNGIIYCAPRSLKITPINGSGFIPPIAG